MSNLLTAELNRYRELYNWSKVRFYVLTFFNKMPNGIEYGVSIRDFLKVKIKQFFEIVNPNLQNFNRLLTLYVSRFSSWSRHNIVRFAHKYRTNSVHLGRKIQSWTASQLLQNKGRTQISLLAFASVAALGFILIIQSAIYPSADDARAETAVESYTPISPSFGTYSISRPHKMPVASKVHSCSIRAWGKACYPRRAH